MYQNAVIKQEPQDQYEDRNEMMDQNAVIKQEPQDQYEDRNEVMDQNAVIKQEPQDQYEDRNDLMDQNVVITQETQDYFSARENSKTPENVQEYKVKGDTLKNVDTDIQVFVNIFSASDLHFNDTLTADIMLNGYYE